MVMAIQGVVAHSLTSRHPDKANQDTHPRGEDPTETEFVHFLTS
jgi:hypothetical protein